MHVDDNKINHKGAYSCIHIYESHLFYKIYICIHINIKRFKQLRISFSTRKCVARFVVISLDGYCNAMKIIVINGEAMC